MNVRLDDESLATMKFGIGQPVVRNEDLRLIQGQGQYTDDINLKGQVFGAMVRSTVAHGTIKSIDTSDAAKMPGVLAVYTGLDLQKAGYGEMAPRVPFKSTDGTNMHAQTRPVMCTDKVRYVGDPLVCVIAESEAQARDAAEAVRVEIEALPAV
ncbi:MAG: xanthine dehydrogenase family protein molybdopterin-binding subunit, partial [Beijerinckiaceae bacterium]